MPDLQSTNPRKAEAAQGVLELFGALLSIPTAGLSAAAATIVNRIIGARIVALRELLLDDLRSGRITVEKTIEEDVLAAFILRLWRSAVEGQATRKLRLMIRYFFRKAAEGEPHEELFLDFAAITDQLTDAELRCLAIIKKAVEANAYSIRDADRTYSYKMLGTGTDLLGLFEQFEQFHRASISLVRFGFVDVTAVLGGEFVALGEPVFPYIEWIATEEFYETACVR